MTASFEMMMELDRVPVAWSLKQLQENTEVLEKVYRSAMRIPSRHTVDRTENLFWQIMWLQDEILKMCGDSQDGPCQHVNYIAFAI